MPPRSVRRAVFRADASAEIGAGHVMRCLTLAGELRQRGWDVTFVCRRMKGDLVDFVGAQAIPVIPLPALSATSERVCQQDARDAVEVLRSRYTDPVDLIVVDSYALDGRWETAVRPLARTVMAIDDLADRTHDCDILLDQNLHDEPARRYRGFVPEGCDLLLGPSHALLRPEFREWRTTPRPPVEDRTVLVSFGGADPTNETGRAIDALAAFREGAVQAIVVAGRSSPHRANLRQICTAQPWIEYHEGVASIAPLMARATLAIGAGGITTWERCCLGLPAICVTVADNQRPVAEAAHRAGVIDHLGYREDVETSDFTRAVVRWLADRDGLAAMSAIGRNLVDGNGAARVADGGEARCARVAGH
jgi:UDP-2,4-diacetamido-2,4,6-trideoxy-beta-L-altropyranose hydrolase